MKRIRFVLIAGILMMGVAGKSAAQVLSLEPILSGEGIALATAQARSTLGADARLVLIGAVGNTLYETGSFIVPLRFDLKSGGSTAWAFAFYSPSRGNRGMFAVVNITDAGMQVMPAASPVPLPDLTAAVPVDLPYSGSGKFVERLNRDSVYTRYRSDLPGVFPALLSYRGLADSDSAMLPVWFPMEGPVWTMEFSGEGDSAMACYMDARSGVTWCARASATSSVPEEKGRRRESFDLTGLDRRTAP